MPSTNNPIPNEVVLGMQRKQERLLTLKHRNRSLKQKFRSNEGYQADVENLHRALGAPLLGAENGPTAITDEAIEALIERLDTARYLFGLTARVNSPEDTKLSRDATEALRLAYRKKRGLALRVSGKHAPDPERSRRPSVTREARKAFVQVRKNNKEIREINAEMATIGETYRHTGSVHSSSSDSTDRSANRNSPQRNAASRSTPVRRRGGSSSRPRGSRRFL